jgi:hypothetical protein
MTILLNAQIRNNDEPYAVPVFRTDALLDGKLDVPENRHAALALFDAFVARFGSEIAFVAKQGKKAASANLVKATKARITDLRARLAEGLPDHSAIRLYGTDATPLGAPFQPNLLIMQEYFPSTQIEMSVDWNVPDLGEIIAGSDRLLRTTHMRAGYQSMGFQRSPVKWSDDRQFPPATDRFRAAVMGKFTPAAEWQAFLTDNIVKLWGPYTAGIFATGWRTYVGAAFADRLDTSAQKLTALADQGVAVEVLPQMTVVTAGPEPIWGDVNKGENVSAYRAAHAFLLPAYCTRKNLARFTLGWNDRDPERVDMVERYLDRLL